MMYKVKYYARLFLNVISREAVLWSLGLAILAMIDPHKASHISICPLNNLGFDWCPGCGLGRSISFALHGDFPASLHAHPFGLFALVLLLYRIATQFSKTITPKWVRQPFNHERNIHG